MSEKVEERAASLGRAFSEALVHGEQVLALKLGFAKATIGFCQIVAGNHETVDMAHFFFRQQQLGLGQQHVANIEA